MSSDFLLVNWKDPGLFKESVISRLKKERKTEK